MELINISPKQKPVNDACNKSTHKILQAKKWTF